MHRTDSIHGITLVSRASPYLLYCTIAIYIGSGSETCIRYDIVEAHSRVDDTLILEQNTTVNDKSNAEHFDPKVFVNCVQDHA